MSSICWYIHVSTWTWGSTVTDTLDTWLTGYPKLSKRCIFSNAFLRWLFSTVVSTQLVPCIFQHLPAFQKSWKVKVNLAKWQEHTPDFCDTRWYHVIPYLLIKCWQDFFYHFLANLSFPASHFMSCWNPRTQFIFVAGVPSNSVAFRVWAN